MGSRPRRIALTIGVIAVLIPQLHARANFALTQPRPVGFVVTVNGGPWTVVRKSAPAAKPSQVTPLEAVFAGDRLVPSARGILTLALSNGTRVQIDRAITVEDSAPGVLDRVVLSIASSQPRWVAAIAKSASEWVDGLSWVTPAEGGWMALHSTPGSTLKPGTLVAISKIDAQGNPGTPLTRDAVVATLGGEQVLRLPPGINVPPGLYECREVVRESVGRSVVTQVRGLLSWRLVAAAPNGPERAALDDLQRVIASWPRGNDAAAVEHDAFVLVRALMVTLAHR